MKQSGMRVNVDAQVFLRIAKHAKQNFPEAASGSLLGLDRRNGDLRVTNCFAFKNKKKDDLVPGSSGGDHNSDDFTEYQYQTLATLAEVRVDANVVGWYESTQAGNFLTDSFIENQYHFQREVPAGVVIVYDALQQRIGKCGFRGYRLTEAAMQKKTEALENDDDDAFSEFPSANLLEEVVLTVHCSPLIETLLLQSSAGTNSVNDWHALDLDNVTPSLEKGVQSLLETLDEFSVQQREMQMYERQTRKQKEAISKNQRVPKTIDTLNLTQQIQQHCKRIEENIEGSFEKLYLVSEKNSQEVAEVLTSLP